MKQQAFQATGISESIVGFAHFCRSHGFNVGLQETQTALECAAAGLICDKDYFRYALKSIFSNSPEDGQIFEKLFLLYWTTNPIDMEKKQNKMTVQGSVQKKHSASLVMLGKGKNEGNDESAKQVSGANETERLKRTNFSRLNDMETNLLEEIAEKLFRQMAVRLTRRMKHSKRRGNINLRRTIRRSIGYGGEPMDLLRRSSRPRKKRLIILLDVSGSMDKYSYFLLRFICILRNYFRQMEAFIFSTSLIRISKSLQQNRFDFIMKLISEQADNWSSGTRIGACLEQFNERYGKLLLNGSPIVIILSDGLDTGDPSIVASEMVKLQRRAGKVLWLNPLKGMKGYEPSAAGMKAALPSVSGFHNAHSLESLLELEKILENA
jgi:uncharacterized protein